MTTWPSGTKASTANVDAGTDRPRLARVDIKQNIDNVNDIIDYFNVSSISDGQFLRYDSGTAKIQPTTDLVTDSISITDNQITTTNSNDNLKLSASGTGVIEISNFIDITKNYKEKVNTLTSSSIINVDCKTASIHRVVLDQDARFVIQNIEEGGSVTLVIQQDSGGGNSADFVDEGSTAVKFPLALGSLSTVGNDIDVCVIFNDGVNLIGSITNNIR